MLRKACNVFPLILIIVGHVIFLTQAALIGYGFSSQANGRTYAIASEAKDANGNVTTRQTTITVAHN